MGCGCSTPAYLRDPRSGNVIPTAAAVAIGQAVETSDGPAPSPDFIPTAAQMTAANAATKPKLTQAKNIAAGVVAGFILRMIWR